MSTNIEWTNPPGYKGDVWNPTTGCDKVSEGCKNCYAMKMAWRLSNIATTKPAYEGTVKLLANGEPNWTGKINLLEDRLSIPFRRKKPTAWFVNSMSDLFHEEIPFDFIDKVFAVMALCPQHIFQVLTKRPERMREYLYSGTRSAKINDAQIEINGGGNKPVDEHFNTYPLKNVWLGVSVEDQKTADERIPILLDTPAAVRWISAEPMIGEIDLTNISTNNGDEWDVLDRREAYDRNCSGVILDWIIVGGESGWNGRRMELKWVESIVRQCKEARVPCFVKQLGSVQSFHLGMTDKKGGNIEEFPKDLQVREYPEGKA